MDIKQEKRREYMEKYQRRSENKKLLRRET